MARQFDKEVYNKLGKTKKQLELSEKRRMARERENHRRFRRREIYHALKLIVDDRTLHEAIRKSRRTINISIAKGIRYAVEIVLSHETIKGRLSDTINKFDHYSCGCDYYIPVSSTEIYGDVREEDKSFYLYGTNIKGFKYTHRGSAWILSIKEELTNKRCRKKVDLVKFISRKIPDVVGKDITSKFRNGVLDAIDLEK